MRGVPGGRRAAIALAPAVLLLAGCGNNQNALAPKSHQARDIASLFWWMMVGAWIGLAVVVALLLLSWKRARRRADSDTSAKPGERTGWYVVVGAGIVAPIVLLVTLFAISDLFVIRTTQAPAASSTRLTVLVVGHQWWWEVRYPGRGVVTANEIHIPVRTPVRVDVRTDDVIHSFWVPQLNRKIDTLPGKTNAIELYADAVGRYRGQCAEFCGLQHAHMGLYVFAEPRARFDTWLAGQAKPAAEPRDALARAGRDAFLNGTCSTCHAIRGTSASGDTGPDLTHLASRTTIAALTLPNTESGLREWVGDPQRYKPGNEMPGLHLSSSRLDELVAYLRGLR
ncbi:MAG TPA: cytochrome c oxidase subunit II [Gaiellaceae bacterium]